MKLKAELDKQLANNITLPGDAFDSEQYWKDMLNEMTDKNSILKELSTTLKHNKMLLKEKIGNLERDNMLLKNSKVTSNISDNTSILSISYLEITANQSVPLATTVPNILVTTKSENIGTINDKIKNL